MQLYRSCFHLLDFANVGINGENSIKSNMDLYPPELVGFTGFGVSFGGKWMGSYAQYNIGKRNICGDSSRNVLKQKDKLRGVIFKNVDYTLLDIPSGAIIYCDPPYINTTRYKLTGKFDHDKFWDWIRKTSKNHDVSISELHGTR